MEKKSIMKIIEAQIENKKKFQKLKIHTSTDQKKMKVIMYPGQFDDYIYQTTTADFQ